MGNQNTKGLSLQESLKQFSLLEQNEIKQLFLKLSKGNQFLTENDLHFFKKQFSKRFWLAATCVNGLASGNGRLDLCGFVRTLGVLLKGDADQNSTVLFSMLGCTGDISNTFFKEFLEDVSSQLQVYVEKSDECRSWAIESHCDSVSRFSYMFFSDLLCKRKNMKELWESNGTIFDESELMELLSREPLLTKCLRFIFCSAFPILESRPSSLLPQCFEGKSILLDVPSLVMLKHNLPEQISKEWHLLYSTQLHGESFATLLGRLLHKGPSLILVRDKEGHVFGGFASQSWNLSPKFTGTESCFTFVLTPEPTVFFSTGYNTNFMYLCLHQHTLPNGMGFGGQLNNFGLWLDSEMEGGHSTPACTTYGSPQLSGSRQFRLDALEAFGIGPIPETDKKISKKSILDSDVGAKALMTMINKAGVSDAIREEDQRTQIQLERAEGSGASDIAPNTAKELPSS